MESLLALRDLAENRVSIELLAPEAQFVYRPLVVAEIFGLGEEHRFDLSAICADHGAGLREDGLAAVDADRHVAITSTGEEIEYDALIVARGARPRDAVPGALTFAGRRDAAAVQTLLSDAAGGAAGIKRIAFAAPGGLSWVLPLYELALMSAAHLEGSGVQVVVASPEDEPLAIFGALAGEAIHELLEQHGVEVSMGRYPIGFQDGELLLMPEHRIATDAVVALPALEGPRIQGLPSDPMGFVPCDSHGAVRGVDDVYAAGDAADYPIKQGGLASQQADQVAEEIAARAGADVEPKPFRPVLRGMLLTGGQPTYLRAEVSGGRGVSAISNTPLWWPPSKVAGRYLAPYLALRPGLLTTRPDRLDPIEVAPAQAARIGGG